MGSIPAGITDPDYNASAGWTFEFNLIGRRWIESKMRKQYAESALQAESLSGIGVGKRETALGQR